MKQLTLGELITKLKAVRELSDEKEVDVVFDFGTAYPLARTGSWRGDYSQVELNYELCGYDNNENHHGKTNLNDLIDVLERTVGKEFTGWKGGEFTMSESTRLWVSNPGNSSHTGVTGIINNGYEIILKTSHFDY